MKVWQIIALVIAGVVTVIGGLIWLIFQMTAGIADTGDGFFAAARSGDYEAAYALTSQDLKRDNSLEDLQRYIEANGFDTVTETSWSSRSFENDTGSLSGSLTTQTGGTIPVEIGLVKEGDEWKINYISKAESGLKGASNTTQAGMPPDGTVLHLVRFHTGRFIDAMTDGDFEYWNEFWTDDVTPQQMEEGFARTPELVAELEKFENVRPEIENAGMNSEGNLQARGIFTAGKSRLVMDFVFEKVGKDWNVAGLSYELN
jgi:hypothetical protein